MRFLAKLTEAADCLLTKLVALALVLALCYGGYALWDTYQIYQGATVDTGLLKYKPQLNELSADNPTLSELIAINPDVRAWISIDDTNIDYPLLQGTDNVKYVNTDVYGAFSLAGSIFLDCRNAPDFADFYSLVYGHHMEGGAMFGDVEQFIEQDYFDAHLMGMLYLPAATYEIELFACVQAGAFDVQVFNPFAVEEEEKETLIEYLRETATHYREIELTPQDRIIGLSTCSQTSTNARTIIYGRLNERQYAVEGGSEE